MSIIPAPIIAIDGKHRLFFKYTSEYKWCSMSSSDIFTLYSRVYKLLIGSLLSWWKLCDDKTEEISDIYHNRVTQLMNIKINVVSADYTAILLSLFNSIKRTLEGYEFLNT